MWNQTNILPLTKKLMINILNLKLVILLEYQNKKTFLQKAMFQIGLKTSLSLPKWKILCTGHFISDLKGKETVGMFYEKELLKTNQKDFRFEKVIKRKDDKLYVICKGHDSSFNIWIDKKHSINERIYSWTKIFKRKNESQIRFV